MTQHILPPRTLKSLLAGLLLLAFAACEVGTTKEASCTAPTNLSVTHSAAPVTDGMSLTLNYAWDATSAASYQVVLTDQTGTVLNTANTNTASFSHTLQPPLPNNVTASVKGQCSGGTVSSEAKLTVRITSAAPVDTVGTVDVDVL